MKKRNPRRLLAARFVCALFATCAAVASAMAVEDSAAGYLTINRFPALGGGLTAFVSIDGTSAGRIRLGQSFHGALPPGDHFISIMVYPNHMILFPAEKYLNVHAGESYVFTLKWDGDRLVLM